MGQSGPIREFGFNLSLPVHTTGSAAEKGRREIIISHGASVVQLACLEIILLSRTDRRFVSSKRLLRRLCARKSQCTTNAPVRGRSRRCKQAAWSAAAVAVQATS